MITIGIDFGTSSARAVYRPIKEHVNIYDKLYGEYKRLYDL